MPHIHEQHNLYLFYALTIRKQLPGNDFDRSGRGQEPSRGHKFSILENSRHFGTASCWGVRSPKPCWKRVRQTGSYSAIFFHFLILVLNVPNGATVLTCINLYTSQTAVLVDSSAHFLICGSNNSSSLNESIIS